jgi:hypothetical protein
VNHWYLVASLPYLRFGEKPPVTRDAFLSACTGWLAEEDVAALREMFEGHCSSGNAVAQRWWGGEVELRNAIVRVRAKSRGADAARFIRPHEGFSLSVEKAVTDAFTRANPLEQEAELDRARWAQADELAQSEPFGFAGVFAFALKLRIAERWAGLDTAAGQTKVEELIEEVLTEGREGRQDA